jgi:hypothetical protein
MTSAIKSVFSTTKMLSLREYISENLMCSFHINIINVILIRNAGRVFVNTSKSSKEFGLTKLKISNVMAIPKTASVRLSILDAVSPL